MTGYIKEGSVCIKADKGVFYNPEMEISRDILSAAIGCIAITNFCDGHSATGIKAIRVKKENPHVDVVYAVDISRKACNNIRRNIHLNKMKNIRVVNRDIKHFLMENNFDFVEIDPFGTPVPYLCALSESCSWKKRGFFSVTATDTAVLCGPEVRACRREYGSVQLRAENVHENGLRILISKIHNTFMEKNIAVLPIFSLSHKHYLKVFFEYVRSAKSCDMSADLTGNLAYCANCFNRWYIEPGESSTCNLCGKKSGVYGPFWRGLLNSSGFIGQVKKEIARRGYRHTEEELRLLDKIEYENFPGMCYDLHKVFSGKHVPSTKCIIDKLKECGFEAAQTHYKSWIIRTNATIKEIMAAGKD
ncbi:MAG: methyltransferase [Candidatus Micrarchaeia archaeon]